jgi:hypothetical protein
MKETFCKEREKERKKERKKGFKEKFTVKKFLNGFRALRFLR